MNIRCPHCQTVFRVNPDRIPISGVRARCARCGDSFMVMPPSGGGHAPEAAAPQPGPASHGAPAPPATPQPPPQPATPPRPTPPAAAERPAAAPPPPSAPSPPPRSPGAPALAGAGATQRTGSPSAATARPPFGQTDPNVRAARIARALVSDIVAYHPDRRDQSLAAGTLRTEFREEIMKSWEEYVAQVGTPMAKSTPYFRDALNAILAKGERVF